MKKCIIILLVLHSCIVFSQSNYYYYENNKVELPINYNLFYLTLSADLDIEELSIQSNTDLEEINFFKKNTKLRTDKKTTNNNYRKVVKVKNSILTESDYENTISLLSEVNGIRYIEPIIGQDEFRAVSTYFYIKLNNTNDFYLLEEQAKLLGFKIERQVKYMPLWYALRSSTNKQNSVALSNKLFETGLFEKVDPGFIFHFSNSCTNDGDFGEQWNMQNNVNPNIDINVCDAWDITLGANVKVAVIDQGIEQSHSEFSNNLSTISFDATSNSSTASLYLTDEEDNNGNITQYSHGTHVAGIIGANQNNDFVSGVAPEATLMNISHLLDHEEEDISEQLASAISFAVDNGADIINNSWGDSGGAFFDQLHSPVLEAAIENAIQNGRNGLGTIVVFAAGNNAQQSANIDYPANFMPEILSVGSIDINGDRALTSASGDELDVVAPGENIFSTDWNGSTRFLSGTSMAAPHVSGLAALILSVHPCLTGEEVRTIIEKSCFKTPNIFFSTHSQRPNGTWTPSAGYGLINATNALMITQTLFLQGTTENNDANYFNIGNILAGYLVAPYFNGTPLGNYTISSGVTVNLKANENITLKPGVQILNGSTFTARIDNFNNDCSTWNSAMITPSIDNLDETYSSKKRETIYSKELDWKVYPNPFSNYLNLDISPTSSSDYILTIYTALGTIAYQENGQLDNTENKLSINTTDFSVGMYLVQLQIGKSRYIKKIIHYEN